MADKKQQMKLKPMCKYGTDCYQKNAEHRRKYTHPSPSKKDTLDLPKEDGPIKSPKRSRKKIDEDVTGEPSASLSIPADVTDNPRRSPSRQRRKSPSPSNPNASAAYIKEKFLVEMPPDFYDMWEFCKGIHGNDPSEAFSDLGLHLVGPYDVLSQKISNKDIDGDNILCHYRYYYDPPEFMTVITKDGDDGYHVGYFRDDPSEMPFGLASNCAAEGPKLKLRGDNIFAALNFELTEALKKCSKVLKKKFTSAQEDLKAFCKKKRYSLELQTPKTKARDKKIVAKTFHELGIVVPYDKSRELGYRPLPVTNAKLKNILSNIANSETDEEKFSKRDELDEILTNLQFANDECDYGMGLELGIDLFCFGDRYLHNDVLLVLQLAYNLLDRSVYSRTIKAHLSRRRKGNKVSIKDEVN